MTRNKQLIEALRKAEGPSRELDGAIMRACGGRPALDFTREVLDVVWTVERKFPDTPYSLHRFRRRDRTLAYGASINNGPMEVGANLAIALCIAFLVELEKRT